MLRVTSGNFLEMFDFFLFGFYATYIANAFFPAGDEFVSLLATFMTFGAGFLMRPLGAIVLGAYVDRVGRRKGLIVTLAIMAMGTVLIAFVPGYATIGLAAPALVLIGRLLQGFSAGVELGGVSVYLSEMAPPNQKGFYVSWQSGSQQVAIIAAAIIGYILNTAMMPQAIADWGWRIPFFIGSLIVPFIFIIRRSLQETEAFLARKHHPTLSEIFASIIFELVDRAGRDAVGGDDHRVVLPDHRLHADLRQKRTEAFDHGLTGSHILRRDLEPVLAAGDRRGVRPHRTASDPARVHSNDHPDRVSGDIMAGSPLRHSNAC